MFSVTFLERGAARVLTPGVSWVCAQAADPHITSNPGSGCSNKIKYAGGVGAHSLLCLPAVKREDQSGRECVLSQHGIAAFQEHWLIRDISAKFETTDDVVRHQALERCGELVEVGWNQRAGREAVVVVVILITRDDSRMAGEDVLDVSSYARPKHRTRKGIRCRVDEPVTSSIVAIHDE